MGAGPAGLVLAQLLHLEGIDSVVLEARSREYVEGRVRAGVLEHGTVELLTEIGVGSRLHEQGLPHHGLELQFEGARHRIDLSGLTGRHITVYGQQEVVKDLIAARVETGRPIQFEVDDVSVHELESERPLVRYRHAGEEVELSCDVVAGCDGFHGICRDSVPDGVLTVFSREYPFGWLGILARGAAVERGADLRLARPRLLAAQHALAGDHAALPPVRAGRETSTSGPTSGSGKSCGRGSRSTAGRSTRARSWRRASPGCGASSSSRCSTAGSSWPETPRTSSRRPVRRG